VFVAGLSQMPAAPFYYFAPFVAALGRDALAIRVATTIAGLVAILLCWLLGRELFERVVTHARTALPGRVATGRFGADMKVALVNDGPVTILLDSKKLF
jgi:4-amino-4-deoxy-L-arabinose transferase-like glycosyltransferase